MTLSTTNTTELTAHDIFRINLEFFQGAYPHRSIELKDMLVYIDGECKFNTEGYNLLFNLQRLVKCLEDELI